MLSAEKKETLRDKTCRLLDTEGLKIESDQITSVLRQKGCQEAPSGRIRIPAGLIDEMVAWQKKTQAADDRDQELHPICGIDWAHHIIWNGRQEQIRPRLRSECLMSAFDCGPTKYYDYPAGKLVPIDTDIFTEVKKFAQATPEIGYISTWYRQDVPQQVERIESLILGLKYTDKLDGIEAIDPAVIKYLKEISEILTERPGDASYLAGAECLTSPLILESRSAADIVERFNRGIKRYHVASMPTIGVSTPVTLAGATVMTAAEILGGMAVCFAMDPETDISGRSICLMADMRTANNTASAPETTAVNLAVRELFDAWWGGHLWVEVYQSPFTARPGLQAVYDNFCGGWRTAKLLGDPDIPYPGMGALDVGATGSPTQFILDMEIRKSQFALKDTIEIDDEQLPFEDICAAVREDDNFLSSDHTLRHFRQLWSSPVFLTESADTAAWAGDEKAMLDKCEELWRQNVKNWQPPQWPEEKTRALEQVAAKARKELL